MRRLLAMKTGTFLSLFFCCAVLSLAAAQQPPDDAVQSTDYPDMQPQQQMQQLPPKRINKIIVSGNKHVPTEAIISRIPFKEGEYFNVTKVGSLIRNIYTDLKRFRNVTVKGEDLDDQTMNLHVIVQEKKLLKEVRFEGNKQVTQEEIKKKIDFGTVPAVDKEELNKYVQIMKKLYVDKGYHLVKIEPEMIVDADDRATVVFHFAEPKRSLIRCISFAGNRHVTSKTLRHTILSKEDWILDFLDHAGVYHPERLEADRHFIEQLYQNRGFMNARVSDIKVNLDPTNNQIDLHFEIEEGDRYVINEVKAPGNDLVSEEQILSCLPLRSGQYFSREMITNSMQTVEKIWNNRGYMFAHVEPSIMPDDEKKTVNIAFYSELGNKVFLNRLTIKGNRKTKDKVIRRQIGLTEGELLTDYQMENSKNRVQSLGYFEQRDGVDWKLTRISDELADLDLILQEAKTGRAFVKIGIGGTADIRSPLEGLAAEIDVADTNLFGSGIQFNCSGRFGKDERSFVVGLANPWLFDRPILGRIDGYFRKSGYEDMRNTRPVNEIQRGGSLTVGFVPRFNFLSYLQDTFIRFSWGIDSLHYGSQPIAHVEGPNNRETLEANIAYQGILNKEFKSGTYTFATASCGQDFRNHPMHPSRGHSWLASGQIAAPIFSNCLGFGKFNFDLHWYTPLINEYDLIFHLRGYCGFVHQLGNDLIPYRELYHIGGPASVRGFLFGQIGPQFSNNGLIGDSIGGSKAFFWTAELIVPISSDFNYTGVFFYDGGSGWDNPYVNDVPPRYVINNKFDYRHSVGVGIRMMNPMPIKIDWGFKLDPRPGETPYEVHFGMAYEW